MTGKCFRGWTQAASLRPHMQPVSRKGVFEYKGWQDSNRYTHHGCRRERTFAKERHTWPPRPYYVLRIPLGNYRCHQSIMSAPKKELFQVSSYSRRLRDNVKSILENYGEILKASKAGM